MSHVMNTYARQNVAFVKGEGVWLWDEQGKKYLDALAGIAVNTLGYNHPRFTEALRTSLLHHFPDGVVTEAYDAELYLGIKSAPTAQG